MNETFLVGSSLDCSFIENDNGIDNHSTLWKQTMYGCRILSILKDMYHFNVTYVYQKETFDLMSELILYNNKSVDIFVRPMSLRSDVMENTYPVHDLFIWNFGFTIYHAENFIMSRNFYNKPFSHLLWLCLYVMAFFCSILFYFFKRWEIRLVKGLHWECSFGYELLIAIGAYCQRIPPVDAVLYSRRAAYLAFFLFAFLIYTYYTSNLLSYLVLDKKINIDANVIFDSDFECVILEDVEWIIRNNIAALQNGKNVSKIYEKVVQMKSVTILEGLEAIKNSKTALLSDYVSLDPSARQVFENHEICDLANIDVLANLKKYFFVSKDFRYKEKFKVALMLMEETGILTRLNTNYQAKTECIPLTHVQTSFKEIISPLYLLLATYAVCLIILAGEMVHFKRNRLWPYVE